MLIGMDTSNFSAKIRTEGEREAQLSLALNFLRVQWTVEAITEKQTNKVELYREGFGEWQLEMNYNFGGGNRKAFLEEMALTGKMKWTAGQAATAEAKAWRRFRVQCSVAGAWVSKEADN